MATRLFLRSTTNNTAGYAATEKSTALPAGTPNLGGNPARDLSATPGTSVVAGTLNSLAQTAHQDGFFRKFISEPLAADITAQTWTLGVAVLEGNNAANAFIVCSVYVLKSDDTVRGYVYDDDTPLGSEWSLGSIAGRVVTFSGAAVSSVESTDRLVLEFWYHGVQSMANAYTADFGYNGTTDIADGVGNADPASYLETPQDGLFASGSPQSITVAAAAETEAAQAVAATPGVTTVVVGATTETEIARSQGIGLGVIYVEELEVSTVWLSVGAVTETEAAATVTPHPASSRADGSGRSGRRNGGGAGGHRHAGRSHRRR